MQVLGILKDLFWIGLIVWAIRTYRTHIKNYWHTTSRLWYGMIVLVILTILMSVMFGKSVFALALGIKYGLRWLVIFLSATWLGWIINHHVSLSQIQNFFFKYQRIILTVIVCGALWQVAKMIFPQSFYELGYGVFGDFVVNQNPPLYYLTGPSGFPRLSGIFAGPNQYGYFLIAFFPLMFQFLGGLKAFTRSCYLRFQSGVMSSLVWTFSRAALIAGFIQLIVMFRTTLWYYKKILVVLMIGAIGGMISLSWWKWSSTHTHLMYKFLGVYCVAQQPLGYGLGSS